MAFYSTESEKCQPVPYHIITIMVLYGEHPEKTRGRRLKVAVGHSSGSGCFIPLDIGCWTFNDTGVAPSGH